MNVDSELNEVRDGPSSDESSQQQITATEVMTALTHIKPGKAPGIYWIDGDLFRSGKSDMVLWLAHQFNVAWTKEEISVDWCRNVNLPNWKRKGDK